MHLEVSSSTFMSFLKNYENVMREVQKKVFFLIMTAYIDLFYDMEEV